MNNDNEQLIAWIDARIRHLSNRWEVTVPAVPATVRAYRLGEIRALRDVREIVSRQMSEGA